MEPGAFPECLRCPSCPSSDLRPHGGYRRYVDGRRMWIRRGLCPHCGVTHAILPEDVCAYRDLALDTLASVLTAAGPSEAARALGDASPENVRRIRRWRRSAVGERTLQAERVLPSTGSVSTWWERTLEAYGDLVSWRHRQWAQTGYFVTPLLGLFRHGRPPWMIAVGST